MEVADASDIDLAWLYTQTVRAILGANEAGEGQGDSVLSPIAGPTDVTRDEDDDKLVWLARVAWVPGQHRCSCKPSGSAGRRRPSLARWAGRYYGQCGR